jgi:hypothetical protein
MPKTINSGYGNPFIRNFNAGERLEMFFVTSITSIFVIRLFLALTGYPRLGGGDLHIAHMLWGGMFMLLGLMIRIMFIGQRAERWTVFLGGIGFGTFIDEIGKFITSDNNYFFRPAPAIIYMIFIILVLFVRIIFRKHYSQNEYLLNALRVTGEIAIGNASLEEKKQALKYLDKTGLTDPFVNLLHNDIQQRTISRSARICFLRRIKTILHRTYSRLVRLPGFNLIITLFFSFQLITRLIYLFVIIFLKGLKFENILRIRFFESVAENLNRFTFIEWVEFSSTLISAAVVFWGFLELRRSRFTAFVLFERSILINIFITQFFVFYQDQFGALFGLFANLMLLAALRFMIHRETAVRALEQ